MIGTLSSNCNSSKRSLFVTVTVALLALSNLSLGVNAIDCTLCDANQAPSEPLSVIPFLTQGLKTCRSVFDMGVFQANQNDCDFIKSLGRFACSCEEGVDLGAGDTCTICSDGSDLPSPNLNLLPGLSCLELQSNAGRNEGDTCAGYQRAFGPYCGCANVDADAQTCRLCTGNSILPRPFQVSGSQTCLAHEFFANLSRTCSAARAEHGAACCGAQTAPPTSLRPTPPPNPDPPTPPPVVTVTSCFLCDGTKRPANLNAEISVAGSLTTCQEAFETGNLGITDGDLCSFTQSLGEMICQCTDELIMPEPPTPAPVNRGEGCFLCAGDDESPFDPFAQLVLDNAITTCQDAFAIGNLNLNADQCEFIQNIGREICLCSSGTPPAPNMCPLCEDGSALPDPEQESLPDLSCADLQTDARRDFADNCASYQGGIGAYCGCDNPASSAQSCRLCGAGNLLPRPLQMGDGLGDLSCIQHEFLASLTRTCGTAQQAYADTCCAPNALVVCFAGDANVVDVVRDTGATTIPMRELQVGDLVKDGDDSYSRVYSFGHYHHETKATYLQIHHSTDNKKPLEISSDHMVFVMDNEQQQQQNKAVPAGSLSVGDMLILGSSSTSTITKIKTVVRQGAFAPFTESGKLVVNGILASSYVSMETDDSGIVTDMPFVAISYQWLAHMSQAPHRLFCSSSISRCNDASYNADGLSHWVAKPLEAAQWWTRQSPVIKMMTLLPSLVVMSAFHVMDMTIRNNYSSLLVLGGVVMMVAVAGVRRRRKKVD